ncbi:GAF domain-containing protein, partial [Klebsiella pneumoniae]|nr:GAF domain-containing protein [Klebsiella pneumoniae]
MKLAGLHPDEQRRLQSLRSSGLLNSGKEERFDRLTRLARSLYNLPVASISLVGEDLLHIKSCAGLDVDTVPRDISFCAHTILQTDPLIVNDMQQDERFHDNPLVIEAPFIRFYAGYPVQLPDGATVGSFCLMDHQPRSFSAHEMQILSDLAAIVEDEFKVLDAATSDELTGLFNRRGFLTLAEYALLTAQRRHEPVSLAFVDLDRF